MTEATFAQKCYTAFIAIRVDPEFKARLKKFAKAVGRSQSDTVRFLLLQCLNSYQEDKSAIMRIRQEMH